MTQDARIVCNNLTTVEGLKTASRKLVRTILPVASISKPAGVCIQELATRIQKKKSNDALGSQQRTEDIADHARVFGPVGAKGKFHHDAGRRAHNKDQRQKPGQKIRNAPIDIILMEQMQRFGNQNDQRRSQRHHGKENVESNSQGKLHAG